MNAHVPVSEGLLHHIRRMVPRYTSYPTAPHFTADVTGDTFAGWLEGAGAAEEGLSLYLHVPFCRSICAYCGCTTKATRREEPVLAYAELLGREIDLLAARAGGARVSHIHWGGGTPNILPPEAFQALVERLARHFRIPSTAEHAIELDPRHVGQEGARHLAAMGVTRVSLGVQTLDAQVQTAIGRVQPEDVVDRAFSALRAAGIARINADLMYGLPLQSLASVEASTRRIAAWRPSRIAMFGYAHVPWMKSHQKLVRDADLPDADLRLAQAALARAILVEAGYAEVSSISATPSGYAQNAPDIAGWRRAIEAGRFATVKGRAFAGQDRIRAEIIRTLLCRFEVQPGRIAEQHGYSADVLAADLARLAPLVEAGWITLSDDRLVIRTHRVELARVVASA
ncbi:MAG: coproporphyrinogen III oxidase, partial [Azorhizobium sp. 32-67-21]